MDDVDPVELSERVTRELAVLEGVFWRLTELGVFLEGVPTRKNQRAIIRTAAGEVTKVRKLLEEAK